MRETPTISASAYASATTNMGNMLSQQQQFAAGTAMGHHHHYPFERIDAAIDRFASQQVLRPKETDMAADTRRLVQVFLADPDPNVPLDKALLYTGDQKLTDLSDQELFFEIDINGLLQKHNEFRITLTDKSIKSKSVSLEPARIRDLKMTVVTIASF